MLFCCLKGSYDVIKRIIVPPSFIAYTFFGSVLQIFSHHDVDMWGRVWMSCFRGAWMSLNFYKEYLFGFETLVFATSGILSVHEQLVTLQRERKTWNMTPLRNIMYYIYIYIYISSSSFLPEQDVQQEWRKTHTVCFSPCWSLILKSSTSTHCMNPLIWPFGPQYILSPYSYGQVSYCCNVIKWLQVKNERKIM